MNKVKEYVIESWSELNTKVSWPTWAELQSSTIIVMIASLIIAMIVFVMDTVFSGLLQGFYSLFN